MVRGLEKLTMKTYGSNMKTWYNDLIGKRAIAPPPKAKVGLSKIEAPSRVGRAVLTFHYGVFGDNMPVLWVRHVQEGRE